MSLTHRCCELHWRATCCTCLGTLVHHVLLAAPEHARALCCRAQEEDDEDHVVALPTKTLDGRLVYEKRASATRPKLTKVRA